MSSHVHSIPHRVLMVAVLSLTALCPRGSGAQSRTCMFPAGSQSHYPEMILVAMNNTCGQGAYCDFSIAVDFPDGCSHQFVERRTYFPEGTNTRIVSLFPAMSQCANPFRISQPVYTWRIVAWQCGPAR